MKPPGTLKPSPPPLAGLQASQGGSTLMKVQWVVLGERKREGVGSWRCWGDGQALAAPSPLLAEHGHSGFGKQEAFPLQKQTRCNTIPVLGG